MNDERASTLVERTIAGDAAAAEELLPIVYEDLRRIAARYVDARSGAGVLQPTMLVHEAYMRLAGRDDADFRGKTHFIAVAAVAMRRVLIDFVRERKRAKRGGDWQRITISGLAAGADVEASESLDAESLAAALDEFSALDPRAAQVVELRFFGGLSEPEIAGRLGVSERTVRNDWAVARAWLRAKMTPCEPRQ